MCVYIHVFVSKREHCDLCMQGCWGSLLDKETCLTTHSSSSVARAALVSHINSDTQTLKRKHTDTHKHTHRDHAGVLP